MHCVSLLFQVVLVAQAVSNGPKKVTADAVAENLLDVFMGRRFGKLADRPFETMAAWASPFRTKVNLERTALGKSGRLAFFAEPSSPIRAHHGLAPSRASAAQARHGSRVRAGIAETLPDDEFIACSASRRQLLAAAVSSFLLPREAAAELYMPPSSVDKETILITGANTGLGLESATRLAQAGAKVVLTARTQAKADAALAEVKSVATNANVVAVALDLASLESIRSFPARYDTAVGSTPLDVLIANAGVMAVPQKLTTADGFERQVGVNHLGHFALVSALMPLMRKAANGFRIIFVSSDGHRLLANKDVMTNALESNLDPKAYSQWGQYGISKAANILFASELQRRFDAAGIPASAVSLHPGTVPVTGLARYLIQGTEKAEAGAPLNLDYKKASAPFERFFLQGLAKASLSIEEGANTQIFLAAGADSGGDLTKDGGKYFVDMQVTKPSDYVNSQELASKLWSVSEVLTGTTIPI